MVLHTLLVVLGYAVLGVLTLVAAAAFILRWRCRWTAQTKVLLLTQYLGMGGLERVILNLARGMTESGRCKPLVFVYDTIPNAPTLNDDFRALGVEVIAVQKDAGFSFKVVREIAKAAWTHRVSVIHSHDLSALIYAVFAKWATLGAVKVVNTQHSFVHINNGPLYVYYERVFTFLADTVCAVSEGLKQQYATVKVNPERVHLVQNGMEFPSAPITDTEALTRARKKLLAEMLNRDAAKELESRLDWVWVLCMARIHRGKGQDHVLDVWHHLALPSTARVVLIFLGQETFPGTLAALTEKTKSVRDSGNVIFAGYTKKPADWHVAAHIFITGSEFEGMPLGPIEALGTGVEVLLSDIPGHSMLPAHVGRFPLTDKQLGAVVLKRLIELTAQHFSQTRVAAWDRARPVREAFGIAGMTSNYERLYLRASGK